MKAERDRDFVVCFHTRAAKSFFLRTTARRLPHITGRRMKIVSLRWVGAPNERAPFRVDDAAIGFVDQCLTGSRIADQGVGVS